MLALPRAAFGPKQLILEISKISFSPLNRCSPCSNCVISHLCVRIYQIILDSSFWEFIILILVLLTIKKLKVGMELNHRKGVDETLGDLLCFTPNPTNILLRLSGPQLR